MARIYFISTLFALLIAGNIHAQEEIVLGKFFNEEGTSIIRIFKATNGKYYGKVEWLKTEPDRLDVNNPIDSKRNTQILGMNIANGFTYSADKHQWSGGTIYDPENGKTYDCYLWFEDGTDTLHLKGYILGMRFIGRETEWKRVKD